MKDVLLYSIFVVIIMAASAGRCFAQVAVNTNGSLPDSSAMLDISSSTRGLLVPRMTTTDRIAVESPEEGLLVYDKDTHSFWFFKSGNWSESLATSNGWSFAGNSLTGTEFLGSTNNQPVKLYSSNSERMRIDENGNVGIGTANPTAKVDIMTDSRSIGLAIDNTQETDKDIYGIYSKVQLLDGTDVYSQYAGYFYATGSVGGNSSYALFAQSDATNVAGATFAIRAEGGSYPGDFGVFGSADVAGYFTSSTQFGTSLYLSQHMASQWGLYSLGGKNYCSGNLGIGIENPANKLHVVASSNPLRLEGLQANTTDNDVLVSTSTGVIQKRTLTSLVDSSAWCLSGNALTGTEFLGSTNSQPVKLYSNNLERMRIDENGNVGIGVTIPDYKLDIDGDLAVRGGTIDNPDGELVLSSSYFGDPFNMTFSDGNVILLNAVTSLFPTTNAYTSLGTPALKFSNLYVNSITGSDISSGTVTATTINASQIVHLTPLSSAPSSPAKGDMYFDGTANILRVWDGSAWMNCW